MKRLFIVTILFAIVGFTGCKHSTEAQSNPFITVNVTAKYPQKELLLQDFLDVEYIPLKTSTDFITMAHIETVGQDLIIVRNRNRSTDGDIFFFDRNGNGIRKINRLGQSAEEYLFLLGVTLDEDNGEIFVNDHWKSNLFVYDLLGNFKRSFKYKEATSYSNNVYNFDPDHLICHDINGDLDEVPRNIFLILSKQDGSITKEIEIPFQEKKSPIVFSSDKHMMNGPRNEQLIPSRDGYLLVEPSSDTIYRYQSDHSMTPFIVRTPSIHSMDTEIFLFPGVMTDHYYFMQTVKKEYDFGTGRGFPRANLLYDKQKNAIFEYLVYNDDFSDKTPVNLVHPITLINNNEIAFMQKLEAFDLVEAYDKGKLKGRLKEIAAELDEESNPVIMIGKYKK